MDNLGLFIYLAGVADSLILIAGLAAFFFAAAAFAYLAAGSTSYDKEDSANYFKSAKKWGIIAIICCMVFTLVPTKQTCYEIFGVTAAVELYKSSESLQQPPEKSVKALNRFLDSIASDEDAE